MEDRSEDLPRRHRYVSTFPSTPCQSKAKTHLPGNIELVIADKVGVVTLERVKDERLVRLGDVCVREPPLVREVHFGRDRTRVETGHLRVELQIHGLGRLNTED